MTNKVDGITLLQMIRDGKIKDNTKIIDNTGKRYIYYDSTGNLNEITQLIGDDDETERMYQFTPYQLMNYTFEIIEEIEKPNIPQKISFKTTETQKEKNRLIKDTINQIIDYLEKSEEK